MKMNRNTVAKVATLHNLFSENVTFNRFSYSRFYNMYKGEIPSWGTLKAHGLIVLMGQELLFDEGYEEEFVAVNVYRVNF